MSQSSAPRVARTILWQPTPWRSSFSATLPISCCPEVPNRPQAPSERRRQSGGARRLAHTELQRTSRFSVHRAVHHSRTRHSSSGLIRSSRRPSLQRAGGAKVLSEFARDRAKSVFEEDIRIGQRAHDGALLFQELVSTSKQRRRYCQPKRLGSLQVKLDGVISLLPGACPARQECSERASCASPLQRWQSGNACNCPPERDRHTEDIDCAADRRRRCVSISWHPLRVRPASRIASRQLQHHIHAGKRAQRRGKHLSWRTCASGSNSSRSDFAKRSRSRASARSSSKFWA
jgi:hypothetical protein